MLATFTRCARILYNSVYRYILYYVHYLDLLENTLPFTTSLKKSGTSAKSMKGDVGMHNAKNIGTSLHIII